MPHSYSQLTANLKPWNESPCTQRGAGSYIALWGFVPTTGNIFLPSVQFMGSALLALLPLPNIQRDSPRPPDFPPVDPCSTLKCLRQSNEGSTHPVLLLNKYFPPNPKKEQAILPDKHTKWCKRLSWTYLLFVAKICSWTIATASYNPRNMKQVLYFCEDTDDSSGHVFLNIF